MDEPAWRTASLDQTKAAVRDLAGVLGHYYVSLLEAGFDRVDAVAMTQQLQESYVCAIFEHADTEEE